MDNMFVERLRRSLRDDEVYLNAYATVAEAKAGIGPRPGPTAKLAGLHLKKRHRLSDVRGPPHSSSAPLRITLTVNKNSRKI